MDIDSVGVEKRRASRLKQYQLYQDQLDQIEGEKRTGYIGGKKATIVRHGSSSIQDLFLKIKNKP